MLIMCCLIVSVVSTLPAAALMYNKAIIHALDRFVQTGSGSFHKLLPTIIMFGIITALVGLSNRLNEELLQKDTNDDFHSWSKIVFIISVIYMATVIAYNFASET